MAVSRLELIFFLRKIRLGANLAPFHLLTIINCIMNDTNLKIIYKELIFDFHTV